MRAWSIGCEHLDKKGILGLWMEVLLAQAVFLGKADGYQNHSQLLRFRATANPLVNICAYLWHVWVESLERGYNFNADLIYHHLDVTHPSVTRMPVTTGQVAFEVEHLRRKLAKRGTKGRIPLPPMDYPPIVHPLFEVVNGPVEPWEKGGKR